MYRTSCRFRTSYSQFHLMDDESDPDLSDVWDGDANENRLALTDGFVGIGTLDPFADVVVELILGETCPEDRIDSFAHVAQCSLEIKSGRLLILPCAADKREGATIALDPGPYRLCILYHWREGSPYSAERDEVEAYEIYLWPGAMAAPEILKKKVWDGERGIWVE